MRLLLAEDTRSLAASLAQGLGEEGFAVDVVGDGESALHLASEIAFDCVVLDRMMPKLDGLAVLKALRARGVTTPVLFLTALGEVHDRVAGLEAGADDYLVKPFAFAELLARVRALVRRSVGKASNLLTIGRLSLDLGARRLLVGSTAIDLTSSEYRLIELLMLHPDETWSRTKLVEHLYDEASDRDSNVIDVFVARLRKKLEGAGLDAGAIIVTQRGAGYRFERTAVPS